MRRLLCSAGPLARGFARGLARYRLAVGLVAVGLVAAGCASASSPGCKRVARDREAFLNSNLNLNARSPETAASPQLLLALPLAPLSQQLSRGLAAVPATRVALPDLGLPGVSLPVGSLSAQLHSLILLPARPEHLAFRARINLRAGAQAVTAIDLEAEFRPRLDLQRGLVHVAITPADIARVRPTIPTSERRRLGDFLYAQVPAVARRLVSRQAIDGLVKRLTDDLLGGSWPAIRDRLLGDVGTLSEFTIDLPDLPIAAIALRSTPADLLLAITSDLPAAGLPTLARAPTTPATQPQLQLSGAAAAALVNWEMARGTIPERYTREGVASPRGTFTAGVSWEPGPRPLKLHVWDSVDTCAYVRFGGTPKVALRGGSLEAEVNDARIEASKGAAKVRAALWFSRLGRQTFAVSESAAASLRFELFGAPMRATASAVHLASDTLTLGLTLVAESPQRPPARR